MREDEMRRALPLLLPLLLACGGPETNVRNVTAEIVVSPPEVDFGAVGIFQLGLEELYITNDGLKDLEGTLAIEGPGADVFSVPENSFVIPRDEALTVPVGFAPETALPFEATLIIESNDPDDARIEVPLLGVGEDIPLPDICIYSQLGAEIQTLDLGTVAVGETKLEIVSLKNCGRAPLDISTMDQAGSGAFRVELASDPTGATVAPDATHPLIVYYSPVVDTGDSGSLTFHSNDPDEPQAMINLLGNGGDPNQEVPIAVIDCPGTSAPPQVVVLDGSGSYDPSGLEPLDYQWTLISSPTGSQAALTQTLLDTTSIFTDIGGEYQVQLQVTNTIGLPSAPERCIIDAIPADDIHVELTWDTTGVDLDLHMLQNTTAELFDTPEDCNWCNKNPSWGSAGTGDDPRLDLDDRSDGPENINILAPSSGAYPVAVHYFDPLGGPATTATVTVYTNGTEVWQGSKIMQRNDVWQVGQVNWPDGSFGVYTTPLETAIRRQCQ